MSLLFRCVLVLVLLGFQTSIAQNTRPTKSPEPNWISRQSYDYTNTALDKQAEYGYIDLVSEQQVCLKDQATYYKRAYKIMSEAGVQNNSELSFTYDPAYSKLTLHSIKIIRNEEVINQLDLSKIKTIQQEKELTMHSYDGSLSAIIFLEDVRKGDIIEYSYTITGFNPIFKGKYSRYFESSFSSPLYHLYYKLIVPPGRNINIKNSHIKIDPQVRIENGNTSYEWRLNNLSPVGVQDNIPSWYDAYSMIMVSEYNSWSEVNAWASTLFPKDVSLSPGLKKKIEEIKSEENTEEARILAALRFVQDDIRYMGIEMGVNSHQPSHPNKIFAQRYGDCKDKSYLLCNMLNAMGIDASPVLINTEYKKTISEWLPTHAAFDHVTVRVKLNDKYYWFDPTISYQRGRIQDISFPDYQRGLVISDTSTSLTAIPFKEPGITSVKEIFDIPNTYGNARLRVITKYSGSFADDMRRSLHSNSLREMEGIAKDYYSTYFEEIECDSLNYSDNESTGILTIREYYSLNNLWENSKGKKRVSFQPYVITGVLDKPKDTKRKMPFYLSYPAKYKEEIEINLPEEWKGEESEHNVRCDGFKLKTQYSYNNRKFQLVYQYETLKDHIDPSEIDEYLEKFKKANESLAYELSLPGDFSADDGNGTSPLNITGGLSLFVLFLILVCLIVWVVKRV